MNIFGNLSYKTLYFLIKIKMFTYLCRKYHLIKILNHFGFSYWKILNTILIYNFEIKKHDETEPLVNTSCPDF